MKKLNDLYEKYFTLYSQFEDVIKNHEMVRHLSEIADGKNQSKLSFERYILTHYFDEIIYYANLRLIEMTDSRYSLIRRVDVGRGASGLELDVFDQHTSKKRSVKSLSGGESFKASLSLALGLAEIVQNYSGGISLETMFIDEGFGTLDPESLDSAIETLLKLEKSNRKVGVISHVSELKKRIPAKINIIPNQEGSTIKLEY
jgi:exonuclease SbcC